MTFRRPLNAEVGFQYGTPKPNPVHRCSRCRCFLPKKKKYCAPCSADAYDEEKRMRTKIGRERAERCESFRLFP